MSEIDDLMSLDPLSLTKNGPEIEAIIAYYRNNRAKEGADGKMKRAAKPEPGQKPTIDLTNIIQSMAAKKAPSEAPKPKPSGGFRRL